MRKAYLLIVCSVLVSLAMMGIGIKTHAWIGNTQILIQNREGWESPRLTLVLMTNDPTQAEAVKSIRAWNTNPLIDDNEYTNWIQYNERRKEYTNYQFVMQADYTGQYGEYVIEVTYQDDSTEPLPTVPINPWTAPYDPPGELEVDYSTGYATPTFRFMPVDDTSIDYYEVRLRCDEGPNQSRMIYRTRIYDWTPGKPIEVTYPQGSDGEGTEEPLQPWIEYHVRALAWDQDGASSPPTWRATFRTENRRYFSIPPHPFSDPFIIIVSRKNSPRPKTPDGTFFTIDLLSLNLSVIRGVKEISAANVVNPTEKYQFSLTPSTWNLQGEWSNSGDEFTGQQGTYKVTVLSEQGSIDYYTRPLPAVTPLPVPQNLQVSFASGNTTPTLSFDPIDDPDVYYDLRIYDADFSRRIYRAVSDNPSVRFPEGRIGSTAEDLIPGEEYIFRACIVKNISEEVPGRLPDILQGNNYLKFTVPKKRK